MHINFEYVPLQFMFNIILFSSAVQKWHDASASLKNIVKETYFILSMFFFNFNPNKSKKKGGGKNVQKRNIKKKRIVCQKKANNDILVCLRTHTTQKYDPKENLSAATK